MWAIFQNDTLKKWPAALDPSPEMAVDKKKADPIRPFPGSNTPAKALKPPFSDSKPVCHKRWPNFK